jgi:hypothetical protein
VRPTLILVKTVIDERQLYITKLLHPSTPSNSRAQVTNPPTTKSVQPPEPMSTLTQSRIWLPFLDNTAVRTTSVHQVSQPQQTLPMPDRQATDTSKRSSINNRTQTMPSLNTTHPIRPLLLLSLDRLFMVKGEVSGLATWLSITMALFLKHAANGHHPCLATHRTGRLVRRAAMKSLPDHAYSLIQRSLHSRFQNKHAIPRPKYELSNLTTIYPHTFSFQHRHRTIPIRSFPAFKLRFLHMS